MVQIFVNLYKILNKYILGCLCLYTVFTTKAAISDYETLQSCARSFDDETTQCLISHSSANFARVSSELDELSDNYEWLAREIYRLRHKLYQLETPHAGRVPNTDEIFINGSGEEETTKGLEIYGVDANETSPNCCPCPTIQNKDIRNDTNLPLNCLDIWHKGHRKSGVYTVYEPVTSVHDSPFRRDMRRSLQVYCDLDILHGGPGWLVFQRRKDGSVNFTRPWVDYRNGFGNLSGEFWLGNANLALLTGPASPLTPSAITDGATNYELRIEMEDWEGERRYARYSGFQIRSEDFEFQLVLGNFIAGDAGDSFSIQNGQYFSTIDRENDSWMEGNCAQTYRAGYWFGECMKSCLNCPYYNTSYPRGVNEISWNSWLGTSYSLKYVEMKLRPELAKKHKADYMN